MICLAALFVAGSLDVSSIKGRASDSMLNGCRPPEPCRYFRIASPRAAPGKGIRRPGLMETPPAFAGLSCRTEPKLQIAEAERWRYAA